MECYALAIREGSKHLQFHFPNTLVGFFAEKMYRKYETDISEFSQRFDAALVPPTLELQRGLFFNAYKAPDNDLCIIACDRALNEQEAFYLFFYLLIEKVPIQTVISKPDAYLSNPKIAEVKAKLDETKQIMLSNLERTVLRGERIKHLADHAQELEIVSHDFKEEAKKLNSCWPAWGCSIL